MVYVNKSSCPALIFGSFTTGEIGGLTLGHVVVILTLAEIGATFAHPTVTLLEGPYQSRVLPLTV